jgi:hypothetical protein
VITNGYSDALVMMDADVLTEERLQILSKIVPSDEEIAAIAQYAGDFQSLGNVEQFFAMIGGLPIANGAAGVVTSSSLDEAPMPLGRGVQRRVASMLFRVQFNHAADVVERWLGYVEEACKVLIIDHFRLFYLIMAHSLLVYVLI